MDLEGPCRRFTLRGHRTAAREVAMAQPRWLLKILLPSTDELVAAVVVLCLFKYDGVSVCMSLCRCASGP